MDSKKRNIIKEIFSFGIIGVVNTAINYAIYSILVFIGIDYRIALFLDYCFGITISFFLNKNITFKHKGKITYKIVFSMIGSYLIAMCINFFFLIFFVEYLYINKYFSQFIALSISVAISFLLQKFVVFKKGEEAPQ